MNIESPFPGLWGKAYSNVSSRVTSVLRLGSEVWMEGKDDNRRGEEPIWEMLRKLQPGHKAQSSQRNPAGYKEL